LTWFSNRTSRSIIINDLEARAAQTGASVAYIYFNYKNLTVQTPSNLVSSILQQLVICRGAVGQELATAYKQHKKKKSRPTFDEWVDLAQAEARRHLKMFMVVDALDEAEPHTRNVILDVLRKMPNVNLLLTSRPAVALDEWMPDVDRLDILARDEDLRKYIVGRLPKEHRLLRYVKDEASLGELIAQTVTRAAQGMQVSRILNKPGQIRGSR